MSEPVELIVKGKETLVGFACAKCGAAFLIQKNSKEDETTRQRALAKNHCDKQCQTCGAPVDTYYQLTCMACQHKANEEKERRRFEKAEKLTIEQYDGPVVWGDEFYSSVEDLLDHCESEGLDLPEFVWATTRNEFKLSAEDIIDRELELQEMHEDAYDSIPDKAKRTLQAYFDVWCKEVGLGSYDCDTSRVVVLRTGDLAASA